MKKKFFVVLYVLLCFLGYILYDIHETNKRNGWYIAKHVKFGMSKAEVIKYLNDKNKGYFTQDYCSDANSFKADQNADGKEDCMATKSITLSFPKIHNGAISKSLVIYFNTDNRVEGINESHVWH